MTPFEAWMPILGLILIYLVVFILTNLFYFDSRDVWYASRIFFRSLYKVFIRDRISAEPIDIIISGLLLMIITHPLNLVFPLLGACLSHFAITVIWVSIVVQIIVWITDKIKPQEE